MSNSQNPYAPLNGIVEQVIVETPTIKTLMVRPDTQIPFRAGQFMQLTVPGVGEAPFTPSSSPNRVELLDFTILDTGTVTHKLHNLNKGDRVGLRGPFGKGYPVDKLKGKEVLVVGGGVGLAPLRSLLYVLFDEIAQFKRVSIKYGARSPQDLVYKNSFEKWSSIDNVDFTVTVDGAGPEWKGNTGVVTTILDNIDIKISDSIAVVCGPEIMLKFVTLKLIDIGYKAEQIYLSMNRRMSCGTGKCGRCNIGPYYLCKDGPDMNYALIKDYPNVFGM
ncbi:MAG: FAD/NAD(P)-binding protein [Candidatus Latescibacteria bacterium]|nr:FAD/NAD(P)-binding protein [Candidatus Latescibacterota bacterium]